MSNRRLLCISLALLGIGCAPSDEDPPDAGHTQQEAGANAGDADVTGQRDSGRDTKLDAQIPAMDDAGSDAPSRPERDASAEAQSPRDDGGDATQSHSAGDASAPAVPDAATNDLTQTDPYLCGQPALGPNELLDVGHAHWITTLSRSGDHVLSHDQNKHWILWDAPTRTRVASGDAASVALAGTTLIVTDRGTTEVRSIQDGARLASFRSEGTTGLSSDGSYVWSASGTRLTVWSPDGSQRFRRSGNYARAQVHAGPTELRIAQGAAGDDLIELISAVDGNTSFSTKYVGKFASWFADGGRFLSRGETALHVYTKAGQEEQVVEELPPNPDEYETQIYYPGGQGDYFWFTLASEALRLYRVGQEQPLLTQPDEGLNQVVAGPGFMASLSPLRLYDLRGDTVQVSEIAVNSEQLMSTFAIDKEGRWVLGSESGVVLEKSDSARSTLPRLLSCGAVRGVAGSRSGRTAVAVASGSIYIHDLTSDGAKLRTALSGVSEKVQLSDDGSVLVAQSFRGRVDTGAEPWLRSIALPSGAEIHGWAYPEQRFMLDFELSRDGSRIATQVTNAFGFALRSQRDVTSTDGATSYFSGAYDTSPSGLLGTIQYPFLLSAKGTFVAFPIYTLTEVEPRVVVHAASPTLIYRDGMLQGMADGQILGWLDDTRMLVHQADPTDVTKGRQFIAGVDGKELAPARVPMLDQGWTPLRAIDDRRIYAPPYNRVYDIVDGAILWQRPADIPRNHGDVASEHVVYSSGRKVLFEKY